MISNLIQRTRASQQLEWLLSSRVKLHFFPQTMTPQYSVVQLLGQDQSYQAIVAEFGLKPISSLLLDQLASQPNNKLCWKWLRKLMSRSNRIKVGDTPLERITTHINSINRFLQAIVYHLREAIYRVQPKTKGGSSSPTSKGTQNFWYFFFLLNYPISKRGNYIPNPVFDIISWVTLPLILYIVK